MNYTFKTHIKSLVKHRILSKLKYCLYIFASIMAENKIKVKEESVLLISLRQSLKLLGKNDPLRMAGATAFFATFALPAIVLILSQLFGLFLGRGTVGRGLIKNISNTLGEDGADQVRQVIRTIRGFDDSWYVLVFGFLFLVFVATTLFTEIKNSMNQLWQISVKDNPGFFFLLKARTRSFAVILLVGILFFADLLLESMEVMAGNYIDGIWQGGSEYFKNIIQQIASIIIVATWFSLLFRFLADGRPTWKAAFAGGLLTGVLFIAGRSLLRFLLIESNIGNLYGPAGSFVLILLFVFYSSFILYYGASFIVVYSEKRNWPLIIGSNCYKYRIQKMKNEIIP